MANRTPLPFDSTADRRTSPLSVGESAPDFDLPDTVCGSTIRLSGLQGESVLLVFFRGTWCPYCRKQMDVLTTSQPRLIAAGIQTLGIVCQSAGSVERYLRDHPIPFPLLVDETRAAAKQYGVHYWLSREGFNLANPSLFILDREHRILFAYRGKNMSDLPVAAVLDKFVGLLEDPSCRE
ncbi:MAG: redoxin domain-containing protein [Cytophagales bacterium]|nr:redoxin domain-containing protein [Armatimonadota bacterium]